MIIYDLKNDSFGFEPLEGSQSIKLIIKVRTSK